MSARPSAGALWLEAGGDPERFRDLLREHGHIIKRGEPGFEHATRTLPCGWEPGKRRDEQDRCEVTDLLRASCSHCTGRGEEPDAPDPAGFGDWFTARYHGRCSGCGEQVRPEDRIRSDGTGGWLCTGCGDAP